MSEGSGTKSPVTQSPIATISDGLGSPVSDRQAGQQDDGNEKDRKDEDRRKRQSNEQSMSSADQLTSVKNEILEEFKQILNKKGRRYIKDELTNLGTAVTLRNALWSLVESPDVKVEFKSVESSGPSSPESGFSSDTSTGSVASSSLTDSEMSQTAVHGKPLFFRQAIVHSKVDQQGVPVTIAYENVSSLNPPRRTPTKRLNRREEKD